MSQNPFNDISRTLNTLVKREVYNMLRDIIKEYSPEIEDLVTEQLDQGMRGDGQKLPDYSPTSVSVYGKPAGPIRLYDEGDFWEGITVVLTNNGFDIVGKDIKTDELKTLYGEEIIELSKENFAMIQDDFIKIEIIQRFKRYLNENI